MFKKRAKTITMIVTTVCTLMLAGCGREIFKEKTDENKLAQITEIDTQTVQQVEDIEKEDIEIKDVDSNNVVSRNEFIEEETDNKIEESATDTSIQENTIAKINGGADEVGIYSVVIKLTDQAADNGKIEMVYYGAKGSPQENSIVNTFDIEYYKDDFGTYEIKTFFNGEVYQNQHKKEEVKVVNTFDATLRAGSVIITYEPEGGEMQEIFRADAEYFR